MDINCPPQRLQFTYLGRAGLEAISLFKGRGQEDSIPLFKGMGPPQVLLFSYFKS
jgi:hypothetical protein